MCKTHWIPPADAFNTETGKWRRPTDAEVWDMVAGSVLLLRREVYRRLWRIDKRAYSEKHGGSVSDSIQFNEYYSDCVTDRALSIMATYDPDHPKRAAWLTHFVANLRWYLYKKAHGRNGHWQPIKKDELLPAGDALNIRCHRNDSVLADVDIELLLEQMPADQAKLVRWRHIMLYDLDEISGALGVTRVKASKLCQAAREQFQILLFRETPAGQFTDELLRALTADGY